MISLTFNRESRWQLVFFSNMSFNFIYIYDSSFYGVILFYMFQCWIHDHWGVHQSQHDKQLYQVDLWLLQVMLISSTNLSLSSPYRRIAWGVLFNLMSCCRGHCFSASPIWMYDKSKSDFWKRELWQWNLTLCNVSRVVRTTPLNQGTGVIVLGYRLFL